MRDLTYYDSQGDERWAFAQNEGYIVHFSDIYVVVINDRVYNYFKDLEQAVTCLRLSLPN